MVVCVNPLMKPLGRQGSDIGRAGQHPAQAADGVFDSPLLPGGVRVAEERLGPEGMDVVMAGERRAIVKGDRLPAVRGAAGRGGGRGCERGGRGLAGRADGEAAAGGALMAKDTLYVGDTSPTVSLLSTRALG